MGLATDEIKARLNIVDLIGDYVQLQKAGSGWKARCPFHNEKTPSFSVNEEKQFWHCFGCGKGGDAFSFLMEIEGLEFREALEKLAERTGVDLSKYKESGRQFQSDNRKKIVREILELSTKFYEKQLWGGLGKKTILNYLLERGLKEKTIKEFRLGYAPSGWRNLLDFLVGRGYEVRDILQAGLIISKKENSNNPSDYYDRFRDRIMFPIGDVSGNILGYSGRIAPGNDESQAKYINTPETIVYHKGSILYGIDKAKLAIKEGNSVLLVEGNMDAIASWQAGIKNTVAISGTALTPEQLKIIGRYTNNLKFCFDMDEAGQTATKRSAELAFQNELSVFVVKLSGVKDAADAVRDNKKKFAQVVENALPAMEYFLRESLRDKNKNDIEDKKKIIAELASLINSFSNKMEREYWIREIAEHLDISEENLSDSFNKKIKRENNYKENFSETQNNESVTINDENNRLENIQKELLSLLLVNPVAWSEIAKKFAERAEYYLPNKKIRKIILDIGTKANFDFEKLTDILGSENDKAFLRELYLRQKEREISLTDDEKRMEIDSCLRELDKELRKRKSADLIKKIKDAEKNGDKEMVEKLAKELQELL
ncbi:MAG TPA: DNA primase [Candidatus Moranbacteria bacterium]|nr:DNA primase [Candidatus Moranbacteria bacterium]